MQVGLTGLLFMSPSQGVARSYWLKIIHLPATHQSLRWAEIRNVAGFGLSTRGHSHQSKANRSPQYGVW